MSSIKLENVSLDYIIKTGSDSLKQSFLHMINNALGKKSGQRRPLKNSSYRALSNLNLEINKGDRLGILGKNGAGKSSLLRVLAKVYKPNHGKLAINGKIFSLFDVRLGMNIEATGYENIINLSIMRGVSKKDALSRVQDIEEFTELGEFLNSPVRTYSQGMQMKLAFAVATSIPTEIMLIDEIIGAGDTHFMVKATNRLETMIEKSDILVLTSHSNSIIKRFCNKVIVLEKGEIKFLGPVDEGIAFYEGHLDLVDKAPISSQTQKSNQQTDLVETA